MIEPLLRLSDAPGIAPLDLRLRVEDREMIADLEAFPDGRERTTFALNALRIGLLALKQARGRIDADAVRTEGEKILASLSGALKSHEELLNRQVKETLGTYFHPESGRFNERVTQLLRKDGDLQRALASQISGSDSELARTLAASVGQDSPILRLLSPTQSEGVVVKLGLAVKDELERQRTRIVGEFSLDSPTSALSRLVDEVGKKSGQLGTDLKAQIDLAVGELSLDRDGSALHRLRKQLVDVIEEQNKANAAFQSDVRATLAGLAARKAEAARSTRHGDVFEDALRRFVEARALAAGDTYEHTGKVAGLVSRSFVGDGVVTLGSDRTAGGARIVIEAKESAATTLPLACAEIEIGRKNRGAQVGVFVQSKLVAPASFPKFARRGDDLFVVWDAEDASSDVHLEAALSLAEALCTRAALHSEERTTDLETLDRAVNEVEKQVATLDEIERIATTTANGAKDTLKRVDILRRTLSGQVETLRAGLADLRRE
jgi:hypothetical protein